MAFFWVTRDCDDDGVLDRELVIWVQKPRLFKWPDSKAITWLYPSESIGDPVWGKCDVATVIKWCGTYPETARECICKELPGPLSDYPRPQQVQSGNESEASNEAEDPV